MRRSVAKRGAAASTFEHVAREAGVSRGLLHYYFATKEQLLVEAARRDCELRMENLEGQLAGAQTADDFIALMAQNLQETVSADPDFVTLVFELFTLSRRNGEIAAEYAGLMRRTRDQVAGMLASAQREGVLRLHAEPEMGSRCECSPSPSATSPRRSRRASSARGRCWRTDATYNRTGCPFTSIGVPTGRRLRSSSPSATSR
jgi:AcrR family transcriptional regulator